MPHLSVIIPTFNRCESLRRTLDSMEKQSLDVSHYEVIVVDDGSTDSTADLRSANMRYPLHYFYQSNSGSAAARNQGALKAKGEILVFIDDDVTLGPGYLAGLLEEHELHDAIVAMGVMLPVVPGPLTPTAAVLWGLETKSISHNGSQRVGFMDCTTNNLSVKKGHFFEVGMFRDIAGDGRSLWGDVEFGYRAMRHGLVFRRSVKARCFHHDYSLKDLSTALARSYETGITAAAMEAQSPGIIEDLPMFRDKLPIRLRIDFPSLILRKLARRAGSSGLMVRALRWVTDLMETVFPAQRILTPLYRWLLGAELWRGYRDGRMRSSISTGRHSQRI